jgi:peptide/nickel transport system permease protein
MIGAAEAGRSAYSGDRWRVLKSVWRRPALTVGAGLLFLMVVVALFASIVTPYDPVRGRLADSLQAPSLGHLLGTDEQGRDILSRIIYGSRATVLVGGGAVLIAMVLATLIGTTTGYLGGWPDLLVQRFVDIAIAFPPIVLVLSLGALLPVAGSDAVFGPMTLDPTTQRLLHTTVSLGILLCFVPARVIRSATMTVRVSTYIEAARGLGARESRILLRHVIPNILPLILVVSAVQFGSAILIESSLSFLGWGLPPPTPSWGQMLSGPARTHIVQHPLLSVWPGLAIGLAIFGANMLADGLRDLLDPKLRRL